MAFKTEKGTRDKHFAIIEYTSEPTHPWRKNRVKGERNQNRSLRIMALDGAQYRELT